MDKYKSSAIAMILSQIGIGLLGFFAFLRLFAFPEKNLLFLFISVIIYLGLLIITWKIFRGIHQLGENYNSEIIKISTKIIFILHSLIIILILSLDSYLYFFNYSDIATNFFNLLIYSIIEGNQDYLLKAYITILFIIFTLSYITKIFLGIGLIRLKGVEFSSFSGWSITFGSFGSAIQSILILIVILFLLSSRPDYKYLSLLISSGLSTLIASLVSILSLVYLVGYISLIILLFDQSKRLKN